jgi:hypothetical protein
VHLSFFLRWSFTKRVSGTYDRADRGGNIEELACPLRGPKWGLKTCTVVGSFGEGLAIKGLNIEPACLFYLISVTGDYDFTISISRTVRYEGGCRPLFSPVLHFPLRGRLCHPV